MSTWVTFGSGPAAITAFNTYHTAACAANGIPKPGYRQSDNVIQILNQWTTCWVRPIVDGPTAFSPIKALVPDADVATYGLTTTTAPNFPNNITGLGGDTIQAYTGTVDQTKPPTWTDPNTNIVYNTATGQAV